MSGGRRLVAAIPCRVSSSRLYAKPLQRLDVQGGLTMLGHLVATLKGIPEIERIALAVAEGDENRPFVRMARELDLDCCIGSERDALGRVVACGRMTGCTDVLHVTSECPFLYFEGIAQAWLNHRETGADVTVVDDLPDGCGFRLYRLEVLEQSNVEGDENDRSEWIGRFARRNRHRFAITMIETPPGVRRRDLRLTVDYPEDLIVCREVYRMFRGESPFIPVARAVAFLDSRPDLLALIKPLGPYRSPWDLGDAEARENAVSPLATGAERR